MILIGPITGVNKDSNKNPLPVQVVNKGTEENPQWALLITGDIDVDIDMATEGIATAANQRVVASTTEYDQTDLDGNVLTITSSKGVYLKNDGTSDFTITIGSFIFTIKPGEVRCIELETAFTIITFSLGAIFRAFGVTRVG